MRAHARPRVAQYVALMKGAGPLYDELHELLESTRADVGASLLRGTAAVLRERGAGHQLLVTTGYDLALEQALLDAGEEFDVVSYLASGRDRGKFCHFGPDGTARVVDVPNRYATELDLGRRTVVLKLHGSVDSGPERAWESFVVTEDDYMDYLPEGDLASAIPVALAAHLRRSHFLFLGYAMRDWNLRLVLNRFWGGPTVSYRSWAVARREPAGAGVLAPRDIDVLDLRLEEYVGALAAGGADVDGR